MGAALLRADALALPLADESVDLIVTSPPYFALRSYQDDGEHYTGQIGSEATATEFLEALWSVARECWRVLKPTGSMFVNLGDKYARSGGGGAGSSDGALGRGARPPSRNDGTVREKSLMGLPWRYAVGCIDGAADPDGIGWILRAELIWSKPNGLPESVKDRVRRSHEQWFHFTKARDYYTAIDELREPHATEGGMSYKDRLAAGMVDTKAKGNRGKDSGSVGMPSFARSPLGKLPGSVWSVPSEPLAVPEWLNIDHFAAFPQEWPRRLITGWSPPGWCGECGEPRRPITDVEHDAEGRTTNGPKNDARRGEGAANMAGGIRLVRSTEIVGYGCACPDDRAPTTPAVVLDPFGGTGTTAMVARALGRFGVSVDLSADYQRLARWRIFDSGHAAKTRARTNRERQRTML